jgi:regulator of protease activity HflC (stomatin/prohibitin superfamily)
MHEERIGYASTAQAYAEFKNYGVQSDTDGFLMEDFEAMAGVPSTEQMYFAAGGSEFIVDPTVSMKIIDGKSPSVFKKYRKELEDVIRGTLYNYVKDAFRIQLNKFTTDDIVSKRDSIEIAIERHLSVTLTKENFQLEQLTSGLKYPQTIVEAVNLKNKAIQQAMQVENEVKVAEAQAKKLIVAAEAEKKANELRQQALTPAILEKMWIEKWDGKLPVYGQSPALFKDITR